MFSHNSISVAVLIPLNKFGGTLAMVLNSAIAMAVPLIFTLVKQFAALRPVT
jgi:hypothetical protein